MEPQKTPRRTEDRIEMKKTTHLPWYTLTEAEQDREYSPYALRLMRLRRVRHRTYPWLNT